MFKPYIEIELLGGEVITSEVWVNHQNYILISRELEDRREAVFYTWHQIKCARIVTPPRIELGKKVLLSDEQAADLHATMYQPTKKES